MENKTAQIEAVIFDWAGTMVDYGCFAPLDVFIEVFKKRGIEVTHEEARAPMGMLKWDHIKVMCEMERIAKLWEEKYGKLPDDSDVDALYADFEPMLFSILPNYCTPIPGAVEVVERLRNQGMKIGSTTGYTDEMMKIVAEGAKKKGYEPDFLATAQDVPAGRPYPWMVYLNAMQLGVYPMKHIIKVGDTISDIKEGLNSGAWSVGVIKGSSEMGMTEEEVNSLDPDTLQQKMEKVEQKFKAAGAHYVIESIGELDKLVPEINRELANRDC